MVGGRSAIAERMGSAKSVTQEGSGVDVAVGNGVRVGVTVGVDVTVLVGVKVVAAVGVAVPADKLLHPNNKKALMTAKDRIAVRKLNGNWLLGDVSII